MPFVPLRFIGLAWLLCFATVARALIVAPGTVSSQEGQRSSLALVGGRPAVAWINAPFKNVRYARALDSEGTAWSPPVTIFTAEAPVGLSLPDIVCLREVNGHPAVCYVDAANSALRFQRAMDAAGAGWFVPVTINNGSFDAWAPVMEIVDGNPAIVFLSSNKLKYVRALDADGTVWGTPQIISSASAAPDSPRPSLTIVQGRPAVAWSEGSTLWYVRAADAAGDAWNPPVSVAPGPTAFPSMQVVDGRPAIVWVRALHGDGAPVLMYARAANSEGTAWTAPVAVPGFNPADPGLTPSMAVVGGRPAIGFHSRTAYDIGYIEAADASGTSWRAPVMVALEDMAGEAPCLLEVNGRPALTYFDVTRRSLKYVRAGAGGWPPEIRLEHPAETAVPRGAKIVFGSVPAGSEAIRAFTLFNVNRASADLTVQALTIDGQQAAEFSVEGPADSAVPGGDVTTFIVKYAPVSIGRKLATLHIVTNCESEAGPYDVSLLGETLPEIVVERTGGAAIADNSTLDLPLTPAGSTTDINFTVRNPGVGVLGEIVVSIDGPERSQFSLVNAPAPSVAPGGSTAFTLRHTPLASGSKLAAVRIASNVQDDRNKFDFSVRIGHGLVDEDFFPFGIGSEVTALALAADGKILAGGSDRSLTRLRSDGRPDPAFFEPALQAGTVRCIVALSGGGMLIGGRFDAVNSRPRPGLARLEANGSLDESFVPVCPPGVQCLAVQDDGKILAGGSMGETGDGETFLVRLHPDGSLDTTFKAQAEYGVYSLVPLPDGRTLAGGVFTGVDAVVAQLDPDGTAHAFAPGERWSGYGVRCIALQADGKVLVAGTYIQGAARRWLPDGAPDDFPQFETPGYVSALVPQTDGGCLVGFAFNSFPVWGALMAKVRPDGTLESGFVPDNVLESRHIVLDAAGRVLIGGDSRLAGNATANLVRITNGPAYTALQTDGRSTVRWLRSGTAPEVTDVVFHVQPDGSAEWTRLGFGTRIPGGWELSGLTLPGSGQLRAQGRAGGSLMESVAPVLTPLETWRLENFNSPAGTGPGADDADPDGDGLTNFAEYAFGLSPVDRTSSALPGFTHTGAHITASFYAPFGRGDVLYGAESSATMEPGTWAPLEDTGGGAEGRHVFSAAAGGKRVFVRFVVKAR